MSSTDERRRLGSTLLEAGLITPAQLEVALKNQGDFNYMIGEVIALHGWLDQQTIDFFAEEWEKLTGQSNPLPLGHYLQMASLLTQAQIKDVLEEQKKLGLRFGATAVLKGLIKQETIDFFIKNLKSEMLSESIYQTRKASQPEKTARSSTTFKPQDDYSSVEISDSSIEIPQEFPTDQSKKNVDEENFDLSSVLELESTNDDDFDLSNVLEMDDGYISQ